MFTPGDLKTHNFMGTFVRALTPTLVLSHPLPEGGHGDGELETVSEEISKDGAEEEWSKGTESEGAEAEAEAGGEAKDEEDGEDGAGMDNAIAFMVEETMDFIGFCNKFVPMCFLFRPILTVTGEAVKDGDEASASVGVGTSVVADQAAAPPPAEDADNVNGEEDTEENTEKDFAGAGEAFSDFAVPSFLRRAARICDRSISEPSSAATESTLLPRGGPSSCTFTFF